MTNVVTEDDSRGRQKGDTCFYCTGKIGQPHDQKCVAWRRNVRVRWTFVIEEDLEMPVSWGKHDIEFNLNEGSRCKSNILEVLQREDDKGCLCWNGKAELLGES